MREKHGCIYFDKSYKGMKWGKPCNHNIWRADITINGQRFRKRNKSKEFLEEWLQMIIDKYSNEGQEGIALNRLAREQMKTHLLNDILVDM